MPAEPSSETILPQYGSRPYHEHLISWLSAIRRAPTAAPGALGGPLPLTLTTLVAPSASPAIWPASSAHASHRASVRSVSSGVTPERPLARTTTVSLVDVEP